MSRYTSCQLAVMSIAMSLGTTAVADTVLVDNPFRTGFEGWVDVNGDDSARPDANWGVLLTGDKFLFEQSDGYVAVGTTTAGVADGKYNPYVMVNTAVTSPASYTINATMATVDDDGFGLVFGYVDELNYFRLGLRAQANGNLGFQQGTSLQKVVGGVATQVYSATPITFPSDGSPFDVSIGVDGADIALTVNGTAHAVVSDNDLQPGHYGVHSWVQKQFSTATSPQYGTMLHQIGISSDTVNATTNFDDAVVADWRPLAMNSPSMAARPADLTGNFRQDFRTGAIVDDSNGFLYASNDDNIDFIGPAVVIDEPGSEAWGDYRMAVRMLNTDDDGIGLLFRVADDDHFYRLNFARQGMGTNLVEFRSPQGLSIQKYDDGTWSEVYRDDQSSPLFVFDAGVPFDVSLRAIGNTFQVDVINDPDGLATKYSYAPIVDEIDPILTGSVGFASWGNGDGALSATYLPYGGSGPLLVAIPEPAAFVMALLSICVAIGLSRRATS